MPVLAPTGAAIGAALGVVLVVLVLHDGGEASHRTCPRAPPALRAPIVTGWTESPALDPAGRSSIVRNGLAVGLATGAYGVSFGAISVAAGLSVLQTCALSLLVFTGASQFALVGVIAAGGAPLAGAADRPAARHPQHAVRPAAGRHCWAGTAGGGRRRPTW